MQTKGYNYYEKKQKDFIVIKSKLFLDMPRKNKRWNIQPSYRHIRRSSSYSLYREYILCCLMKIQIDILDYPINRALFEDYWVIESTLYNIVCELSTNANLFISQFQIVAKMNEFLAIRFASLHLSLTSIMSDLSLTLN